MSPHTEAPDLRMSEAFDTSCFNSNPPQGSSYQGYGPYEHELTQERLGFNNDNLQDHSYYVRLYFWLEFVCQSNLHVRISCQIWMIPAIMRLLSISRSRNTTLCKDSHHASQAIPLIHTSHLSRRTNREAGMEIIGSLIILALTLISNPLAKPR
jgi:hypothetical protein